MTNWVKIISLAQSGVQGSTEALALIYQDQDCQKKAYLMFRK